MKTITFKIIPFLISLFILIGSVSGICLYSYYKFDANMLKFVAEYSHFEDYKSVATEKQIEDMVKLNSEYYQQVETGLKYYDVKSGNEYTSTPSDSSKDLVRGATWKNGVMHIPGYFDIKAYAVTTWNAESEKYIYSYYFYLYNVNYEVEDIIRHLYFVFVKGIGDPTDEHELYGTKKLELVLEEVENGENGGPNGTNLDQFAYTGKNVSSRTMYIRDNNATNTVTDTTPFVYRLVTLAESQSETSDLDNEEKSHSFGELENCTFSIFHSGDTDIYDAITAGDKLTGMKEIVRGTFENPYTSAEKFNEAINAEGSMIYRGYGENLYKAGYGKFIWPTILLHGSIAFVISGILAVLFYLIWQGDEPTSDKDKKIKKLKKSK